MTSQTNNSVVQEMKAVFAAVEAGNIGFEPLKVSTQSGRKYEVCYVIKTGSDEWVSTMGGRARGYFHCKDCVKPGLIPGGNWYQITLKNGASPEPVVQLLEIEHRFSHHPETLDELAAEEKCKRVFDDVMTPV